MHILVYHNTICAVWTGTLCDGSQLAVKILKGGKMYGNAYKGKKEVNAYGENKRYQ